MLTCGTPKLPASLTLCLWPWHHSPVDPGLQMKPCQVREPFLYFYLFQFHCINILYIILPRPEGASIIVLSFSASSRLSIGAWYCLVPILLQGFGKFPMLTLVWEWCAIFLKGCFISWFVRLFIRSVVTMMIPDTTWAVGFEHHRFQILFALRCFLFLLDVVLGIFCSLLFSNRMGPGGLCFSSLLRFHLNRFASSKNLFSLSAIFPNFFIVFDPRKRCWRWLFIKLWSFP